MDCGVEARKEGPGIMAGDLGRFLLRGRGMREEEGKADRWASIVSEGREWAAGLLAQEERRACTRLRNWPMSGKGKRAAVKRGVSGADTALLLGRAGATS